MFNFKISRLHLVWANFCLLWLQVRLFSSCFLPNFSSISTRMQRNLSLLLLKILLDLKIAKLHLKKSFNSWEILSHLNKLEPEWEKESFSMDHQGQEKLPLLKHVQGRLVFLFFHVMQQNFVNCTSEWARKKSENCLKKLEIVLQA